MGSIILEKINAQLFELIAENDVLGFFASKFPVEVVPEAKSKGLAYTDFKSVFISKALEKKPQTIGFIYMHELLHSFMSHKTRRETRDPMLWNIAADYEINETILFRHYGNHSWVSVMENEKNKMICFQSLSETLPDLDENIVAEQVYALLAEAKEKNKIDITISQDGDQTKATIKTQNGEITIDVDLKESKDEDGNGGELSDLEKEIESLIAQSMTQAKMVGSESSGIFEKILERGNISNKILKKIREILVSIDSNIGYTRSHRTYLKRNKFIKKLPGVFTADKCIYSLVLVIDESGSMTDEELSKVIYGVYEIVTKQLVNIKNVILIRHDIDIIVDENIKDFSSYKRKKSGGTSHAKVYSWIKEYQKKRKGQPDSTYIFITDGYSDIENLKWSQVIGKKVWLLTDSSYSEKLSNVKDIGSVVNV